MNKKLLTALTAVVILFTFEAQAHAFSFGNIFSFFGGNKTAAPDTSAQTSASSVLSTISELNAQMAAADTNVQNSFLNLVTLLSPQEELQTIQSKISQIMNNASASQTAKSTAVSQLINAYTSTLAENKQNVLSSISNLSASDKTSLISNLSSLIKGQADYLDIATDYAKAAANLTKTSQNATSLADNVMTITETAAALKTNAQAVSNVVTQVSNLAQLCGLTLGQ